MGPRPNYTQIETLVEFLEKNPGIAQGVLRTSSAKAETKRKWATLALSLNTLGEARRHGAGWAKYWSEKKCSLKKQLAEHSASTIRSGGGPALPLLSSLDQRMVGVIGWPDIENNDAAPVSDPFFNVDVIVVPNDTMSEATLTDSLIMPNETSEMPTSPDVLADEDADEKERSPQRIVSPPPEVEQSERKFPRRIRRFHKRYRESKISSRSVEADIVTIEAFAEVANHMDRIATAQENMASSLSSLSSAIFELAKRLPLPRQ